MRAQFFYSTLTPRKGTSYWRKKLIDRGDFGVCEICSLRCNRFLITLHKAIKRGNRSRMANKLIIKNLWAITGSHADFRIKNLLWEADHRIPLILGGTDTLDNIRTLCIPCHQKETGKLTGLLGEIRSEMRRASL